MRAQSEARKPVRSAQSGVCLRQECGARGGIDTTPDCPGFGGGYRNPAHAGFQHVNECAALEFNRAGKLGVSRFSVQDFGKPVRSCRNCKAQYKRTVELHGVEATYKGGAIAGISSNYGDAVSLRNITIVGDSSHKIVPCQKYIGNNTGAEPPKNGSDPDGHYCN